MQATRPEIWTPAPVTRFPWEPEPVSCPQVLSRGWQVLAGLALGPDMRSEAQGKEVLALKCGLNYAGGQGPHLAGFLLGGHPPCLEGPASLP